MTTRETTSMEDIFRKDLSGEMVSPDEPGYEMLITDIFATIKTATEMNTGYRTPEEVHEYMGRILGKPLEKSTTGTAAALHRLRQTCHDRERMFHPAVLYLLRTRRHHDWRWSIHWPESQPDYNQPRPGPGKPQRDLWPSDRNRGQGMDRHQFYHPSRSKHRLRSHRRSR